MQDSGIAWILIIFKFNSHYRQQRSCQKKCFFNKAVFEMCLSLPRSS